MKTFDVGQNARRVAREKAAPPPATRKIQDKRVRLRDRAERRDERNSQ